MTKLVGLLRATTGFILNWLAAVLGTAITEAEVERLFHSKGWEAIYRREVFLSVVIAFISGYLLYYRWKSPSAKWVWIVGVCGYAYRIVAGGVPPVIEQDINWATLVFVSLRAVSYSLGAVSCQILIHRPESRG